MSANARAGEPQISSEEQERAEVLKQDLVEPYLRRYFPFVDFDHPRLRVDQKARSLPKQSVIKGLPSEKPAVFCFTYASPPGSSLKRVVQVFVEVSAQEGRIVHVVASK